MRPRASELARKHRFTGSQRIPCRLEARILAAAATLWRAERPRQSALSSDREQTTKNCRAKAICVGLPDARAGLL
jgi:hypothetical protein